MPRRKQPAPTAPAGQRPPAQDSPDPFERALATSRDVLAAIAAPAPAPSTPWELLADLPRHDGTHLRVSSRPAQHGGPPVVLIAVCERGRDGRWWPVHAERKAVAVRRAELPAVLVALATMAQRARDQASADDDGGEL